MVFYIKTLRKVFFLNFFNNPLIIYFRFKTQDYSSKEEICADIQNFAELTRYTHKRSSKLNNEKKLVFVCSCISRKKEKNKSRIKERRLNYESCRYRIIFYMNGDKCYKMNETSFLYHNHKPRSATIKVKY